MRRVVLLSLCILSAVALLAGATWGDVLYPADINAAPNKYLNQRVTVQGVVGKFAKTGELDYKFQYALAYKGLEVLVKTNNMVDDGTPLTVTGQLKYDDFAKGIYIAESAVIPWWILVVGGALVIVLIVVLVLIFRNPKQDIIPDDIAPGHYCDTCGRTLLPSGICPICSVKPVPEPTSSAGETESVPIRSGRRDPGTALIDVSKAILMLRDPMSGQYNLGPGDTKIGRAASNDFVIEEDTVSAEHAKIMEKDGKFFVQDLGSTNGTFVNGEQVIRQQLKELDIIKLGRAEMKFVLVNEK